MDLPKLVMGREMAVVDQRTITEAGISSAELIERAGAEVIAAIAARWDGLAGLQAVVLCGKGNNGGDGFAVARLLCAGGGSARVFLVADRADVQGAAAEHLRRCEEEGGAVEVLGEDLAPLDAALGDADLVIDALLGTGLRGASRPAMARVIERIAHCERPVVAVDIPSGVEANTGQVHGAAVQAVLTVTFGLVKVGQLFYPGRSHCGALHLANIGFPESILRDAVAQALLLSAEGLGPLVPRRRGDEHKGSCGTVAVVAGSVGMTGAAALTADAALRSGAGRVHLGIPASLNDILEVKLSEVMTRPLPEVRKRRCLSLRALGEVSAMLTRADVLALGPGLGRYRETEELVRRLVLQTELPLVLDADGLSAFAGQAEVLKDRSAPLVLTPHVGEFARLSGLDKQRIADAPMAVARDFAGAFGATLVLKGAPTVVALRDGRVAVNSTGNPGMATAGSGDVLTGIIAGLIAQGLDAETAACLGVYVHGRAGDRAVERLG
ncbi:MAG: NAD(P)H-hydrate dehydratase, partial [Gemmatimonadetes bacterium]|nr:NAD(P)H-hydrate dehydratase [Gemmatimonadota bacterium]